MMILTKDWTFAEWEMQASILGKSCFCCGSLLVKHGCEKSQLNPSRSGCDWRMDDAVHDIHPDLEHVGCKCVMMCAWLHDDIIKYNLINQYVLIGYIYMYMRTNHESFLDFQYGPGVATRNGDSKSGDNFKYQQPNRSTSDSTWSSGFILIGDPVWVHFVPPIPPGLRLKLPTVDKQLGIFVQDIHQTW